MVGISAKADLITAITASDCLVLRGMGRGMVVVELMCEDDKVHMYMVVLVKNS